MIKRSALTSSEPVNKKILVKYIKEKQIRDHFLTACSLQLSESLVTIEELQGTLPDIKEFLTNIAVKLSYLEMVLTEYGKMPVEEVVGFMKCCYEGETPSPFNNPESLATFVLQLKPIIKFENDKYLSTTSKIYQRFVQFIAHELKKERAVDERNIDDLVTRFTQLMKHHQLENIYEEFKGLEVLAANVPWFDYDDATGALSLTSDSSDGLALWLPILIPQVQLHFIFDPNTTKLEIDCAEKSLENPQQLENDSRDGERKVGNGTAVTEEFKEDKILQHLHNVFLKHVTLPLHKVGTYYFQELKEHRKNYDEYLTQHKVEAEWNLKTLKLVRKVFGPIVDEACEFLKYDDQVIEFVKNHPYFFDIEQTSTVRIVRHAGITMISATLLTRRFLCEQARTVKMEEITKELNRQIPRFPAYLEKLQKLGQMDKFYDDMKFLRKSVDKTQIYYTLDKEVRGLIH